MCEPIIDVRTETIYENLIVPVPEGLTKPIDVVRGPDKVDIIALGAAMQMCGARINQANGRLHDISLIQVQ